MSQSTDALSATVTSTRLKLSGNGLSIVFNGQDIISAEVLNAPRSPNQNTVPFGYFVRLYLTGAAKESLGDHYDLFMRDVSSPSSWNDKIDPRAGALIALAAIEPMIRSVPSGGGGQVDTIVPDDGIDVDSTDPQNPIVSARVDGVTVGFNGLGELQVPAAGTGYVIAPTPPVADEDIVIFDGTTGDVVKSGGLRLDEVVESYPTGDVDLIHSSGASPIVLKRVNDGDGTSAQANTGSFQINVEAKNSVEVNAGEVQLVGDEASPGNNEYYGTNGSGTKGFYAIPTGDVVGPAGATADNIPLWDGTTGKLLKNGITPGTGVATALGNNADSASGFVTQAGGDARYSRFFVKPTDTARTNNTLSADPFLVLPMDANTGYSGVIILFVSASAAGDFKSRITGPSAPNYVLLAQASFATTGATTTNRIAAAYDSSDLVQLSTADFVIRLQIQFTVKNGPNAGNLTVEWAQNSTSANATTMLAGSSIEYMVF